MYCLCQVFQQRPLSITGCFTFIVIHSRAYTSLVYQWVFTWLILDIRILLWFDFSMASFLFEEMSSRNRNSLKFDAFQNALRSCAKINTRHRPVLHHQATPLQPEGLHGSVASVSANILNRTDEKVKRAAHAPPSSIFFTNCSNSLS